MSNQNHSFDKHLLEQVERLVDEGELTGHTLLDDLAQTIPQADALFQQTLEERLISQLHPRQAQRPVRQSRLRDLMAELSHGLILGILVGMISGALAGGVGARLAMRVSALLYHDAGQRVIYTENGYRVGEITLNGTLTLIITAMLFGVVGGLLYVGVRGWLPQSRIKRGLVFGLLLLALNGSMIFGDGERDMARFGSAWVNVLLFGAIFIAYGLIAAFVGGKLEGTLRRHPGHVLAQGGLVFMMALLLFGMTGTLITSLISPDADAPSQTESLLFLATFMVSALGMMFSALQQMEWAPMERWARPVGYAVLLGVTLIGMVLDVRLLTRIVS